jgi:hypothetical protein
MRTALGNTKIELALKRLPGERTYIQVLIGEKIWRRCIVPFDSLVHEIRKIDQDLSNKFDYYPEPFLPDVIRLVKDVRYLIKNPSLVEHLRKTR